MNFHIFVRFQVHRDSFMPLLLTISCGIEGLVVVLICCELNQRSSDAFEQIEFTIDEWHWHLFPIEMQKMLLVIIANAQKPVEFECFGSITCSRTVFRKVSYSTDKAKKSFVFEMDFSAPSLIFHLFSDSSLRIFVLYGASSI